MRSYVLARIPSLPAIKFCFYYNYPYLDHYLPFNHDYILKIHVDRVLIHNNDMKLFFGQVSF